MSYTSVKALLLHAIASFVSNYYTFFFGICCFIGLYSCRYSGNQNNIDSSGTPNAINYAQGFSMKQYGDATLLSVSNPWQGAHNVSYNYVLCPKDGIVPEILRKYTVIRTPVERVVCLSTTHVAMLSRLGKIETIKGLAGTFYVSDTAVREAVADGQIVDIGYDQALNYERIISLKPDIVFAYGIGEEIAGSLSRLTDLGQTVILNAEYLEPTALGKAEWLKFMAAFYGCEQQATEKFDSIAQEYEALRSLTKDISQRPTVLCGLPWQGTWYIPGGKSFMAEMIADAGGNYLWSENSSHESQPIHIEAIMNKAATADFWLNTGVARTLNEIKATDERLTHLKPYQNKTVFNNYARVGVGGGNDVFESGTVNPHIILKDMIKILHPDLLPNHKLYYYMHIE